MKNDRQESLHPEGVPGGDERQESLHPEGVPGGDEKRKIPVPPFYGLRSVSNIPVDEVFAYLDEKMLFDAAWGTKLKDKQKKERLVEKEYKVLLNELKEESIQKGWLDLKAVYGYFRCRVTGADMDILGADGRILETIHFVPAGGPAPSGAKGKKALLTDYFLEEDLVAFQAVTVGGKISDAIIELNEKKEYSRVFLLHGLSVHLTEALAAYVHDRIRRELRLEIGQGKRYSPGYPLWRDIEDQKKIFKILDIKKRLSVELTEACQMVPEQSTTAMIVHNEQAEY